MELEGTEMGSNLPEIWKEASSIALVVSSRMSTHSFAPSAFEVRATSRGTLPVLLWVSMLAPNAIRVFRRTALPPSAA